MTKYTALDIAKYILNKCYEDNVYISNLQLQKILYFLQVEYLKKHNTTLFDDNIEAWHYGPVISVVYNEYSGYGGLKIEEYYKELSPLSIDLSLVDEIIEDCREKPPWVLVDETHREGGAWDFVYNRYGHRSKIDIDLIKELDINEC